MLLVISIGNLNHFFEWYAQGQPENVNPGIAKAVLVKNKGLYVWNNEEDAAIRRSLFYFFNFGMKMKICKTDRKRISG